MSAESNFVPKVIGLICNWCCYGGADLCGVSRFQYPPYIRLIRVMCSGRVDLKNVMEAFANGADGVFIGGCHLDDCHYITHGNYDAYAMVHIAHKLMEQAGVNPRRLRLDWVSAGEGIRFANIMNEYGKQMKEMGPLGVSEGVDLDQLRARLEAVAALTPYIRLVERERMRVTVKTEEAYEKFYNSDEFDRLFDELILSQVVMGQITGLLRDSPRSTAQISEKLGLTPSEVARHMKAASRHALVSYDSARNCYELAGGIANL